MSHHEHQEHEEGPGRPMWAWGQPTAAFLQPFTDKARQRVFEYVSARLEKTDTHVIFEPDDVYVVWACKTLQNWKCLVSTTLPDGMYYEVTYNGDEDETYLDAYKKFENIRISEGEDSSA